MAFGAAPGPALALMRPCSQVISSQQNVGRDVAAQTLEDTLFHAWLQQPGRHGRPVLNAKLMELLTTLHWQFEVEDRNSSTSRSSSNTVNF